MGLNIVESVLIKDLARRLGRTAVAIQKDIKRNHYQTHMAPTCTGEWMLALTADDHVRYLQSRAARGLDRVAMQPEVKMPPVAIPQEVKMPEVKIPQEVKMQPVKMPANVLNARALKVTCVLDPSEIGRLPVPNTPRVVLTIRVEGGRTVSADINTKALRKAQAAIAEHAAVGCAVIIQGKLVGEQIVEAGLVAQPKLAKPEPEKVA